MNIAKESLLHRIALCAAILGLFVSIYLGIQKQRGFSSGCWGLGDQPADDSIFNCNDPKLQRVSVLFGVPSSIWAFIYFSSTGALLLTRLASSKKVRERANTAVVSISFAAVPYVLYLLGYQFVVAKAICPLCVIVSFLAITITSVVAAQYFRSIELPQESLHEFRFSSRFMFGGICAMLSLLYYDAGIAAGVSPKQPPASAKLDSAWWTQSEIPALGSSSGIPIVAFFDPNCPHCADAFHDTMSIAETYGGSVKIYIIPRLLWKYSLMQTEALEVARQKGKYYEMWALQFKKSRQGGMDYDEVAALFKELEIEMPNLIENLSAAKDSVLKLRDDAEAAGIKGTPAFFINGERIAHRGSVKRSLQTAIQDTFKRMKPVVTPE